MYELVILAPLMELDFSAWPKGNIIMEALRPLLNILIPSLEKRSIRYFLWLPLQGHLQVPPLTCGICHLMRHLAVLKIHHCFLLCTSLKYRIRLPIRYGCRARNYFFFQGPNCIFKSYLKVLCMETSPSLGSLHKLEAGEVKEALSNRLLLISSPVMKMVIQLSYNSKKQ